MEDFSFNLPEGYSVVNVTDNNCSIAYGNENTHVGGLEISQMKKSVLSTKGTTEIMTYLQENFHKTNNVEFAAFVGGEKRPYVCITLTKIDDVTGEKSKYYHVFFEKNRHVCHAWFDEDVIDQEVEKHIISLLIEKQERYDKEVYYVQESNLICIEYRYDVWNGTDHICSRDRRS